MQHNTHLVFSDMLIAYLEFTSTVWVSVKYVTA